MKASLQKAEVTAIELYPELGAVQVLQPTRPQVPIPVIADPAVDGCLPQIEARFFTLDPFVGLGFFFPFYEDATFFHCRPPLTYHPWRDQMLVSSPHECSSYPNFSLSPVQAPLGLWVINLAERFRPWLKTARTRLADSSAMLRSKASSYRSFANVLPESPPKRRKSYSRGGCHNGIGP